MALYYTDAPDEVLAQLQTDRMQGLSHEEAAARLLSGGPNVLRVKKRKSVLATFFRQFANIMIIVLLVAAAVSIALSITQRTYNFAEAGVIIGILILNAVMGTVQEHRAADALEGLEHLAAPRCRLIREGHVGEIEPAQLVRGDIVLLEAGDLVPADVRLIESHNLRCVEAALTGESMPADKDAGIELPEGALPADRVNMAFSGCTVAAGHGVAVVTATGMDTEMGKVAGMLQKEPEQRTPLQKRLDKLGRYLAIAAVAVCAVIFLIGLIAGDNPLDMFMVAAALAVSAIPEGLPIVVTIVLALGVQHMARRGAIMRRLSAVEALGGASVICSDKTGTLTQNNMTLSRIWTADNAYTDMDAANARPGGRGELLLTYAALACDAMFVPEYDQDGKRTDNTVPFGDPTETALIAAARARGIDKEKLNADYERVFEIPFDSERKLMTVVCRVPGDSRLLVVTKGAYDRLLNLSININVRQDAVHAANIELASDAMRVLAVGFKFIDSLPDKPTAEVLEYGLELLGLLGMMDPPRPEAREAVALCRSAGVTPVVITGDHELTARAIAKELDIFRAGNESVSGEVLASMSEADLKARIDNIAVYSRVSPGDKLRVIRAWQAKGQTVVMTGDGVNDAPALQAADIGCAMGVGGTEVAKDASDMILTDDNFSTIVEAVRFGRGIFDNIKKAIIFLLGTNTGELLTVLAAMLIWRVSPLLAVQLLWINVVTDSFPALAIGMEPADPDIMKRRPDESGGGFLNRSTVWQIVLQGVLFAALTLGGYAIALHVNYSAHTDVAQGAASTVAFMILGLCQIFHSFNIRTAGSIFTCRTRNPYIYIAALASLLLVALVLFVPPLMAIFGIVRLPWWLYLVALGFSLVPVPVMEIAKAIGRGRK